MRLSARLKAIMTSSIRNRIFFINLFYYIGLSHFVVDFLALQDEYLELGQKSGFVFNLL